MEEPKTYSVRQAAALLDTSEQTVRYHLRGLDTTPGTRGKRRYLGVSDLIRISRLTREGRRYRGARLVDSDGQPVSSELPVRRP